MTAPPPIGPPEKYVTDDHNWRSEVIPGCYFLQYVEQLDLTIYGEVIGMRRDNAAIRYTRVYSKLFPHGPYTETPIEHFQVLLSQEQFEIAKKLGWPSDVPGRIQVLDRPGN